MKQRNILLQLFFAIMLISSTLITFGQAASKELTSSAKIDILKRLFKKPDSINGNVSGQVVSTDDITPCSNLLIPAMKRHGIDSKRKRSKIIWRKTMKVTDWESFTGNDLLTWMTNIPAQFPPHKPDEIEIRIVLGVYTEDFLKKYVAENLRESKRNRITAFLIPYLLTKDKVRNQITATIGKTGFDLGGLHP